MIFLTNLHVIPGDGQPSHNVNVADGYLPEIQIIKNIAFRVINIATLMIGCITKMITRPSQMDNSTGIYIKHYNG